MKTKQFKYPSLALVTGFAVFAALCAIAGTARAEQMFVSVNSSPFFNGGGNIYLYDPTASSGDPNNPPFLSNLDHPRGVTFDSDGNLYVATFSWLMDSQDNIVDFDRAAVLKVDPATGVANEFATFFGGSATAIATDADKNVFVSSQKFDDTESTIYKITPGGARSTFGSVPGQCFGLAFDGSGNLFATGVNETLTCGAIYKFTSAGVRSVFVGDAAFCSAPPGPIDLTFDSSGNLFVSTSDTNSNGEIRIFDSSGTEVLPRFATGFTKSPRGLRFDSDGNLFLAEIGVPGTNITGDIWKFIGGTQTTFATQGFGSRGNRGPEYVAFPPPAVQVAPVSAAVTLSVPNPTSDGTTSVTSILPSQAGDLPSGYQLAAPNLSFEIETTITYTSSLILAFQVPNLDAYTFSQLRVLHNEGGTLVDVTASDPPPDPATQTIYANVSSLSPFELATVPGLPSLGRASAYTLFALDGPSSGGKQTANFSNGTDSGKVAVAAGATLQLQAASTINGNLYVDFGGSVSGSGRVNGTRFANQDLSGARDDALNASLQAAGLAPNFTFSNITKNQMVNGVAGVNVVNVTGKINLNNASLTLNGPANAFFVVNVAGSITFAGSGGIVVSGGMQASHLLINMTGSGNNLLNMQVGNVIQGTLLGPNVGGTLRGHVGAALLGQKFSLSNVTLTHP